MKSLSFRTMLRIVWRFVRFLLYSVGCLILTGVLTLATLVLWGFAVWFLFANVLSQQQTEWVLTSVSSTVLNVFYSVDCSVPCEDWPTREELERAVTENADAIRNLKELHAYPEIITSEERCPDKAILYVRYGGYPDIRPIGEVLEQIEETMGIDIPCRFINT